MGEQVINKKFKIRLFVTILIQALLLGIFGAYYVIVSTQFTSTFQIAVFIVTIVLAMAGVKVALFYLYDILTRKICHYMETGENIREAYRESLKFPVSYLVSALFLYAIGIFFVAISINFLQDLGKWSKINIAIAGTVNAIPSSLLIYFISQYYFKPITRRLFNLSDIISLTEFDKFRGTSIKVKIIGTFILISVNTILALGGYFEYVSMEIDRRIFVQDAGMLYELLILGILNLIIAAVFGIMLSKNITFSLEHIKENISQMAAEEGDLSKRAIIVNKDEIGRVSGWYNLFLMNMRNVVMEVQEVSDRIAEIASLISNSYEQIKASAQEVTAVIKSVSDGAERQVENVNDIVFVSQEIENDVWAALSASENVENMVEIAGTLALDSRDKTDLSAENVNLLVTKTRNTVNAMRRLRNNIEEISVITETIKNISVQTNLLALNAAIESARAGEQGEGFGVIAEEIRQLNDDTNAAAIKISDLITDIRDFTDSAIDQINSVVQEVDEGRKSIELSKNMLFEVINDIEEADYAVSEITHRTNSQQESLHNILQLIEETIVISEANAGATEQIAHGSLQQLESVKEMSVSARELKNYAEGLQSLMSKFKV